MDLVKKVKAVVDYSPQGVERVGDKIWFTYVNRDRSAIPAYYDIIARKFKSVVRGKQYGKKRVAVRNLVARQVVESVLQ